MMHTSNNLGALMNITLIKATKVQPPRSAYKIKEIMGNELQPCYSLFCPLTQYTFTEYNYYTRHYATSESCDK